eukprot:2459058-Prymnesium_polylepis.1
MWSTDVPRYARLRLESCGDYARPNKAGARVALGELRRIPNDRIDKHRDRGHAGDSSIEELAQSPCRCDLVKSAGAWEARDLRKYVICKAWRILEWFGCILVNVGRGKRENLRIGHVQHGPAQRLTLWRIVDCRD